MNDFLKRVVITVIGLWVAFHLICFAMISNGSANRYNPIWQLFGPLLEAEINIIEIIGKVIDVALVMGAFAVAVRAFNLIVEFFAAIENKKRKEIELRAQRTSDELRRPLPMPAEFETLRIEIPKKPKSEPPKPKIKTPDEIREEAITSIILE